MANPGDILAPKLLADGTFEETVLTPAAIGAASSENLTAETSARQNADTALQTAIDGKATLGEGVNFGALTASELVVQTGSIPEFAIDPTEAAFAVPIVFTGPSATANKQNFRTAIGAASAADLATLESSLGTLSTQSAEAVEILGGSAHFDTLSAGNDHAAVNGNLTIAANGDIIGTGENKLIGFAIVGVAGGATY